MYLLRVINLLFMPLRITKENGREMKNYDYEKIN